MDAVYVVIITGVNITTAVKILSEIRIWKDVTKMLNNNGGYSSLPLD